jgi:hypothetical protein
MTELLGALAFAIMTGAQFLAVIAVHRIRQETPLPPVTSKPSTERMTAHTLPQG